MLKKKFPETDLHMNSNIIIHMDDKNRLKSHYMKKYADGVRNVKIKSLQSRPAGTKNFLRIANHDQAHLNGSRRRILNDFISNKQEGNLDSLVNRNKSDYLK